MTKPINVRKRDGSLAPLDTAYYKDFLISSAAGLTGIDPEEIFNLTLRELFDGVHEDEIWQAVIQVIRTKIEIEPNYSIYAGRVLLEDLWVKSLKLDGFDGSLRAALKIGIEDKLVNPLLLQLFDIEALEKVIDESSHLDENFSILSLQTLADRYFLHHNEIRYESPQIFFMRVAMGLSIQEEDPTSRAIEFYEVLANMDYMSSTPTLFNSGMVHSQLASCFLTTIGDDLVDIYQSITDNAILSKWSGGLGNDWTPVRALGSLIKSTNGKSQGVIPFLKVANDTAVAVNQGGKRKGAVCAYLETWHLDIEEFLELRKNTGDDRRRTHDMNTANWVPDLFMQRVIEEKNWTLFSPSDTPDLHDLYGKEFAERYTHYEKLAEAGKIRHKSVSAVNLWRKMLSMIFETGHPWITFKDVCNLLSPQRHVGVVHSSNLCTEITLNTSADEIAVCNLGSINIVNHVNEYGIDKDKLRHTVRKAVRMLDNVIDINFYGVPEAQTSNIRHRPIGLGILGFQDALYKLGLPYASVEAVEFADELQELIALYSIEASIDLAAERGAYSTFKGSTWDKLIFPHEKLKFLKEARPHGHLDVDETVRNPEAWEKLRVRLRKYGIRNSNITAIAPTATISNICGVSQSIEPTFQNLYVKSNLSGEFTVVNTYLVAKLRELGLWDQDMINQLKQTDGSVQNIPNIPDDVKALFATAFEILPKWLIDAASRRQKWLDQSQSLNLYISEANGKKLDTTYKYAYIKGLKTTYYLRALGATSTEKSTVNTGALNAVKPVAEFTQPAPVPQACSIDNPDCEACQ